MSSASRYSAVLVRAASTAGGTGQDLGPHQPSGNESKTACVVLPMLAHPQGARPPEREVMSLATRANGALPVDCHGTPRGAPGAAKGRKADQCGSKDSRQ